MNSGFGDPNSLSSGQSSHSAPQKAAFAYSKDSSPTQREDQGSASGAPAPAPAHGWTEHTAPEGYVYYYNSKSGVSQWERPMELDYPLSN